VRTTGNKTGDKRLLDSASVARCEHIEYGAGRRKVRSNSASFFVLRQLLKSILRADL
jgi:hypothetical protein